jgi:hypothetical protein
MLVRFGVLWGLLVQANVSFESSCLVTKLIVAATFINVLMGKTANTGGVTKVNAIAGKISKYKFSCNI